MERSRRNKAPMQNNESIEVAFGTWNIRGNFIRKMDAILNAMKVNGIKVLTLSDTKIKDSGEEHLEDFVHLYSGRKDDRAAQGVSVLISNEFNENIIDWEPVSERILTVSLDLHGYNLCIVAIYGPCNNAVATEKIKFDNSLKETLEKFKENQKNEVVLLGDFNARTGKRENHTNVGPHGEMTVNTNGRKLIRVCTDYNLKIQNGFFNHGGTQYTFEQPKNMSNKEIKIYKSIVDYAITKLTKWTVKNTEVIRDAECGTDHFLVKVVLVIPINS